MRFLGNIKFINALFCFFYLVIVFFVTLFSRNNSLVNICKLDLFWSYKAWYNGNMQYGRQILLNIAMFIPFGYYLANVFHGIKVWANSCSAKKWFLPLGVSLVVTILIETIQYFWGLGLCDADDIFSNTLGTIVGLFLFNLCALLLDSDYALQWKLILSFFFMLAGLAGCTMNDMTEKPQSKELIKQFDFDVTNVTREGNNILLQGYFTAYNCKIQSYKIYLKEENNGNIYKSDTEFTENTFNTIIPVESEEKFEVDVKFKGFNPMNTFTYINKNKVEYVGGQIIYPETYGTDLDRIVEEGLIKVYVPEYEVFVYECDKVIYWLIGTQVDKRTEIIFHLQTNEPEKLPEHRKKYKFDNRGFHPGGSNEITNKIRCGKYRVFERALPAEYNITAVTVGFNTDGEIAWTRSFRVKK